MNPKSIFVSIKEKFHKAKSHPKVWKYALIAIAGLVAALVIFRAGMTVGFRKAQFSYGWSEGYRRNFGGPPPGGMGPEFMADRFVSGHGVTGSIIGVEGDALLVQDRDGAEKTVAVDGATEIRRLRETIRLGDLKAGDFIVVIGDPDEQGQVRAKLIRVMPEPPRGGRRR